MLCTAGERLVILAMLFRLEKDVIGLSIEDEMKTSVKIHSKIPELSLDTPNAPNAKIECFTNHI